MKWSEEAVKERERTREKPGVGWNFEQGVVCP
jgi:hypothetical protein